MNDQQKAESAIVRIQMEGTNLEEDWQALKAIEGRLTTALEAVADSIEDETGERPQEV